MICDRCDGVLNARFEPLDFDGEGNIRIARYKHHETLSSLQVSIEEGCLVCCRLSSQIMLDELIQSSQQNDENSFADAEMMQSIAGDTDQKEDSFSFEVFPGHFRDDPVLKLHLIPLSDATMSSLLELLTYCTT